MSKRSVNRIRKAIALRQKSQARVDKIRSHYQPRLDKITLAMELRSSRWVAAVRDANSTIRAEMYSLTGKEMAVLRRQYPGVSELGVGAHVRKEIA